MRGEQILNLKDCTEFRQTLLAKSPRLPHVTAIALSACLLGAVAWGWMSQANLIVRAGGRVRPLTSPTLVFSTAGGEITGASMGSRITQVHKRAGDQVHVGDKLLELDADRIDAEIERQAEIIRSGEDEAAKLGRMLELLEVQYTANQNKLKAEVDRALEQIAVSVRKQESEIRLATAEVVHAKEELAIAKQVATKVDLLKAELAVEQFQEKLAQAALPVERGHLVVLERALDLANRDYEVKRQELSINLTTKQGTVSAAKKQLDKLTVERRNTVLVSPIDGVVTRGQYEVGNVLPQGEPAFEIASQQGLLFEAGVPSEDIGHIAVGMPVRIKLDAYDYQKYGTLSGEVAYVSPDSATDDEKEKQVVAYLVRVSLPESTFGRGDQLAEVKLGMAGSAEIVTGQESILYLFFQKVRQSISLD